MKIHIKKSAFYVEANHEDASISTAKQLQGKDLSFNNIADTDAAIETVKLFDAPAQSSSNMRILVELL